MSHHPSTHGGDFSWVKASQQHLQAWGKQAGCEILFTLGPIFSGFKQR